MRIDVNQNVALSIIPNRTLKRRLSKSFSSIYLVIQGYHTGIFDLGRNVDSTQTFEQVVAATPQPEDERLQAASQVLPFHEAAHP